MKYKNQLKISSNPDKYDEVKQSFKHTKYRFVGKKKALMGLGAKK